MFIAAMLHSSNVATPVRVRNMSPDGALLETAATPDEGAIVRLVRGSLEAQGTIKWSADGRCGVRFYARVDVAEWLRPSAHRQQQRVDEVVSSLRTGTRPVPSAWQPPSRTATSSDPTVQIGQDLKQVSDVLEKLAEDFAGDAKILARYHECIQAVDIAVQTLRTAAEILVGSADEQAQMSRLASLRTSCSESMECVCKRLQSTSTD